MALGCWVLLSEEHGYILRFELKKPSSSQNLMGHSVGAWKTVIYCEYYGLGL